MATGDPPSAGELMAYLDGQLPRERREEVRALLESSWKLRSLLADIERGTKCYVDACSDEMVGRIASPEEIWAGARAKYLDRSRQKPRLDVKRSGPGVFLRRSLLRPALWAAVAAIVVVAFVLTRPQAIEAATVIERGQTAETSLWQGRATAVLHQRLQVRTASQTASWQIWSAPAKGRYAERVSGTGDAVRELKLIRARNHMDPQRPLSATAYREWLRNVSVRSETVTAARMEDGASGFRIDVRLAAPSGDHAILASSLMVRQRDWRPVSQRLTVQASNRSEVYEVNELAYEVMPIEQLSASFFDDAPVVSAEASPAAGAVSTNVLPSSTVPPSLSQLFSLEVKVRYALHRMHACSGEPIEVETVADGVHVRGVVETRERRHELTQGLAAIQERFLTVSIRTPEEAASPTTLPKVPAGQSAAEQATAQAEGDLPIELLLPRGANGEKILSQAAIVKLSNDAVQSGRSLLMEAWAIRRLLERYPQMPPATDANDRWLVEAMLQDHLTALEQRLGRVAEVVHSVQPSLGVSEELALPRSLRAAGALTASRRLVETASEANSLVLALFARGGSVSAGGESVKLLVARLAETQSVSAQLRATAGQ